MEQREAVIESTFDYSSFAILMLVLAIVFIVITLIRYKVKKRKPMVLLVISGILVLATIVFFILGHFFGGESEEIDLNQAKEQARIAENIQNNKIDHVLEDIDKLYPPNDTKDSTNLFNRDNLIWNYYMQIGDEENIKKMADEISKIISKDDEVRNFGVKETKEYFRILDNIQNNKLETVLKDIDDLYPSDYSTDYKAGERFELLWNYYNKIGDKKMKKQMLEDAVQKDSLKNEIRVKRILKENTSK